MTGTGGGGADSTGAGIGAGAAAARTGGGASATTGVWPGGVQPGGGTKALLGSAGRNGAVAAGIGAGA